MQRLGFIVLVTFIYGVSFTHAQQAAETATASPAAAAKQEFDDALRQWQQTKEELTEAFQQKNSAGDPDGTLAAKIAEKKQQSDERLAEIIAAGLKIYQQDPQGYPNVNTVLVRLAGFFVIGDSHGDGGDQYEKALPVLRELLEGGAGEKWEDLWVWAGASAYCVNEFDLAEEYLTKARQKGMFDNLPSQPANNPALAIRQRAGDWLEDIPKIKLRWKKEQAIREREAEADNLPRVKLITTKGEVVLELFENEAPQSVASFISLVKQGYYDGVTFHRVMPIFMAQGGDPEGTGMGGPGYCIRDEHTLPAHRKHFRGCLSMAKTGAPNSGGSQFFLTFTPINFLDGRHTVFGRVVEGMEHAAALKRRVPSIGYTPEPDQILSAEVLRDRGHEYKFDKLPGR